jgi:hypothetical protein
LDAHPRVSDDGVSITKCLTEHIEMILMLIGFAYHDINTLFSLLEGGGG